MQTLAIVGACLIPASAVLGMYATVVWQEADSPRTETIANWGNWLAGTGLVVGVLLATVGLMGMWITSVNS